MDSRSLVAALCVAAVSFMLASCASDQESLQQYGKSAVEQPHHQLTLPRKLKLQQVADVKSWGEKDMQVEVQVQKKLLEGSAGERKVMRINDARRRGTWREWVESPNPEKSEYFTMDYSWVRRRRPIHNNQIPFVP